MKLSKTLGAAVATAMALMAFVSTASATTLEVKGVKQTGAVTLKATLKAGTSTLTSDTGGNFINTCTASTLEGQTSTFTGTTLSVPLSLVTFQSCWEGNPTIDERGSLTIENIAGTTNGTVRSIGLYMTWPSIFGVISCKTGASPGTDIGTLTGVKTGNATIDFNAVINCAGPVASTKWEATYTVTSPEGLGVTS